MQEMILVSRALKQSIEMKEELLLSFPVCLGHLLKSMSFLGLQEESIIMAFI